MDEFELTYLPKHLPKEVKNAPSQKMLDTAERVEKTRYFYTESAVQYEVDVFEGFLAGLVLIGVKFSSARDMERFTPPEWFLADVTREAFIAGGMLRGKKYEDIAGHLLRFGYIQKLFV